VSLPDRTTLGRSFDRAALAYDRLRPHYPDAVFHTLIARTGLTPGTRVLEIGAGTGIATRALAARGLHVTALEPGAAMAAVARDSLAAHPDITVIETTFEDWTVTPGAFDLVIAATAFHWLDPETRLDRIAETLAPGGYLAIVEYRHVAGGDDAYFLNAQPCYERFVPGTQPWTSLPA